MVGELILSYLLGHNVLKAETHCYVPIYGILDHLQKKIWPVKLNNHN
jgi:hypothetical protein